MFIFIFKIGKGLAFEMPLAKCMYVEKIQIYLICLKNLSHKTDSSLNRIYVEKKSQKRPPSMKIINVKYKLFLTFNTFIPKTLSGDKL